MQKKYLFPTLSIIVILFFLGVTQFSSNRESTRLSFSEIPPDFEYDGCSMFPDGIYGDCCKTHDDAYFFGGKWNERLQADTELMTCVMEKGGIGYNILGPTMWIGVRIGGAPLWPTSYRWGFGRDTY